MNAYELADLIGLCGDGGYNQDAANMLRQQADRIAELENAKQFIQNFAEEQHRRACALEESQTKPLSDEELNEISMKCYVYPADGSMIFNQHKFARAIEERHGIK